MGRRSRYSPEVRERAVRMVLDQEIEHDSQWATIRSIAAKIGCSTETLRNWVRQAVRDAGRRAGLTTEERQRLKELVSKALSEVSLRDRIATTLDRNVTILLSGQIVYEASMEAAPPGAGVSGAGD